VSRDRATVMNLLAGACWAAALMCLMACSAADTHSSSERTMTVYDFVADGGQWRLSPVEVAVADTGDAAADAVTALLEQRPPMGRESAWSGHCAPGKSVRSVVVSDDLVTVNLQAYDSDEAGDAACDLSASGAAMQAKQLVWTVQRGADTKAPVKLTVGGLVRIPSTAAGDKFVPAH
jgi:hypothetical protein